MADERDPQVLNIRGQIAAGEVCLQAPLPIRRMYEALRKHFEDELLSRIDGTTVSKRLLQRVLNTRAADIPALDAYTFDTDQRVGELAVLVGLLEALDRTEMLAKDQFQYVPAWQLPDQKKLIKAHFHHESLDGYIAALPRTDSAYDEAIVAPVEIKSLMANPDEPDDGSPNEQLERRLHEFAPRFQNEGGINCVLVLPYTSEPSLRFNLAAAERSMLKHASRRSMNVVCLLTLPNIPEGTLTLSLYYYIVGNSENLSLHETKRRTCDMNFGRLVASDVQS